VFAGPIIWWTDKLHSEVFTFSILSMAFVLVRKKPLWSMVLLGWREAASCDTTTPCPLFNGRTMVFGRFPASLWPWGRVGGTHQFPGFWSLCSVSTLVRFDALDTPTRILCVSFCVPFVLSPLVFLLCSSPTYNASPPPLPRPQHRRPHPPRVESHGLRSLQPNLGRIL